MGSGRAWLHTGSAIRGVRAPQGQPRARSHTPGRGHIPAARWPPGARKGQGRRGPSPRRTCRRGHLSGSCAEVVAFNELILLELAHATLEHDFAVHDDVAAVGDADRLVEV